MPENPGIIGLEIRAMRKACEVMTPYQRQDCPICGYNIETAADGILHCKWCGWMDQHQISRNVFNDG